MFNIWQIKSISLNPSVVPSVVIFLIVSSSVYPMIMSKQQNEESLLIGQALAQLQERRPSNNIADTSNYHSSLPIPNSSPTVESPSSGLISSSDMSASNSPMESQTQHERAQEQEQQPSIQSMVMVVFSKLWFATLDYTNKILQRIGTFELQSWWLICQYESIL